MRDPNPSDKTANIYAVLGRLQYLGCRVGACGSRVTCKPAPTDTDVDYLVECHDRDGIGKVVDALCGYGFEWEGSTHYQEAAGNFMSWRRDKINLIVTANADFAARHRVATGLCTRLNLMQKPQRIALFQAVLYGVEYDPSFNKTGPRAPEPEKEDITF